MPYGLIDYNTLNNIAKAIRYKANSNAQYYPRDFATAINGIKSGGGSFNEPVITTLYKFRPLDNNNFNNSMINFREMTIFETTNNIPYNEPSFVNFGSENYPDLKANQNFMQLSEELRNTENKIAFSRQFYNDTVTMYNTKLQVFPSNIIAGMFNFTPADLFKTDSDEARKNVKVDFGNNN